MHTRKGIELYRSMESSTHIGSQMKTEKNTGEKTLTWIVNFLVQFKLVQNKIKKSIC